MKKVSLRDVELKETDLKYEYYRAIKTLCIIMIVFCFAFLMRKNYSDTIENSRFLKYYPKTTIYYQDEKDVALKINKYKLPMIDGLFATGIFKDEWDSDKFLTIAQTNEENTSVIEQNNVFYFTKDNYIFISDSYDELANVQERIKTKKYEFLHNRKLRKQIKKLDKNRDYTILILDTKALDGMFPDEILEATSRLFESFIVQGFAKNNAIEFNGSMNFKNNIESIIASFKLLSENFSTKNIGIKKINDGKSSLIIGAKDFDLWMQALVRFTRSFPDNQYNATLKLIEKMFDSDIEEDIVNKLNGNAIFYLTEDEKVFKPLLLIDTKYNLADQFVKYLSFLQLSNKAKLIEKELDNSTFNVISSSIYPYSLTFGSLDENLFVLGHTELIEKYIVNSKDILVTNKDCDFYIYADLNLLHYWNKSAKKYFEEYNKIEVDINLYPNINFSGKIYR